MEGGAAPGHSPHSSQPALLTLGPVLCDGDESTGLISQLLGEFISSS